MTYTENLPSEFKNQLSCFGLFDVIVVGGGPAGIAAAVTASECGRSVLLIERLGFCGGAAVAGLSGTICGLYMTVEDPQKRTPEQIIFGFAERFRDALYREGGLTEPQVYGNTWVATHDCAKYKKVATNMLRAANITVLYHTQMIDVIAEDDELKGMVLHTKSGFTSVYAKKVIDASGDADVVYKMGLKTSKGNNGVIQNPTMMFKVGNVHMEKYLAYWGENTISPPKVVSMLEAHDDLLRKKVWLFPTVNPGELLVNATKITGFDKRALDVTDPVDHTEAEQFSIYQAEAFFNFMKANVPGCEDSYFIDYATEVGVRQTRTIDGMATLKNDDVINKRKFNDGIVKTSWPIELHYGAKPKTEWLVNDYYEVPFHTLVPKVGKNIIVAGRCLSSEHEALASCRVTAQCFEYGRAAALAADIAISEEKPFQMIEGTHIAQLMKNN
ncbi:FAD-dependent oxidoreductase [Amphritea sp. 2_MG-2023]|uniref:FAD-dependent oxidoreductase n=1 Tax=Amphritea TaxID=515417 RepID=UPI001C0775D5|nr:MULTISPECIES: FAD-dependent oxidoreductase [Amphritea]MBU2967096.1 FAD-dependent oxidoreductase [Amphritea atlantica]MDO6419351.1 FAD-dependent oxidoreductase [Amphritea sp. 2_MG-2023]